MENIFSGQNKIHESLEPFISLIRYTDPVYRLVVLCGNQHIVEIENVEEAEIRHDTAVEVHKLFPPRGIVSTEDITNCIFDL